MHNRNSRLISMSHRCSQPRGAPAFCKKPMNKSTEL